jgi:hypothetical protein
VSGQIIYLVFAKDMCLVLNIQKVYGTYITFVQLTHQALSRITPTAREADQFQILLSCFMVGIPIFTLLQSMRVTTFSNS